MYWDDIFIVFKDYCQSSKDINDVLTLLHKIRVDCAETGPAAHRRIVSTAASSRPDDLVDQVLFV